MAELYIKTNGSCPYCRGAEYTESESRQEGQTNMKCACGKWSVRTLRGFQYPIEDPLDKTSYPAHSVRV